MHRARGVRYPQVQRTRAAHAEAVNKLMHAHAKMTDKTRAEHAAALAKAVAKAEAATSDRARGDAAAAALAAHAAEKEHLLADCDRRVRQVMSEAEGYRDAMDAVEEARRALANDVAAKEAQLEARDAEVAAAEARLAAAVADGEKHAKAAAAANKERDSAVQRASAAANQQKRLLQQQQQQLVPSRGGGGGLRARDANVMVSPAKAKKMALAAKKAFIAVGSREMKLVVGGGGKGEGERRRGPFYRSILNALTRSRDAPNPRQLDSNSLPSCFLIIRLLTTAESENHV